MATLNSVVASLLLVLGVEVVKSSIPVSNFFPFGHESGDSLVPKEDDAFEIVQLEPPFQFFNTSYDIAYVSINGAISFGSGKSIYLQYIYTVYIF